MGIETAGVGRTTTVGCTGVGTDMDDDEADRSKSGDYNTQNTKGEERAEDEPNEARPSTAPDPLEMSRSKITDATGGAWKF